MDGEEDHRQLCYYANGGRDHAVGDDGNKPKQFGVGNLMALLQPNEDGDLGFGIDDNCTFSRNS